MHLIDKLNIFVANTININRHNVHILYIKILLLQFYLWSIFTEAIIHFNSKMPLLIYIYIASST